METRDSRRRLEWLTISVAAFIMSLSATLINVYYAVRGPKIEVNAPKQVIFFRDGKGNQSILSVAMKLEVINASNSYSDVLTDAWLKPATDQPSFQYDGTVQPVFSYGTEGTGDQCELGARCIQETGLTIIQPADKIIELPSGSAKAFYLLFPLATSNCKEHRLCSDFADFKAASKAVSAKLLDIELDVSFHSDGRRRIRCKTSPIDTKYLAKVGFVSVQCMRRSITDTSDSNVARWLHWREIDPWN